ncbi:probable S-adenosylmethionine-dependent methyltransferase At5g37990 [Eucalyptus grandis]|uniref:probable S-adenosylmethionine-dependent methyltransferase At5g37990 n=1 Tax=Eucalyptus grandis TaxID=71139 RepID=UPI00192EB89B|nr:probable S-adenosylmethionine-dependent methyltransferase At5g37990 [Eucalyptus grandis]
MQNTIETLELKFGPDGLGYVAIEFQVFFNNFTSNDFNTLFRSLPCDRAERSHGQDSPTWNKGRIDCAYGPPEVHEAYAVEFARGVERFLGAREQELACGGLMALVELCLSPGTTTQRCLLIVMIGVLGSCLVDTAIEGLLSENDVDSFNLPRYYASQQELETVKEINGLFSIERIELLDLSKTDGGTIIVLTPSMIASYITGILEGLIKDHFRAEIVDWLFTRFEKKRRVFPIVGP